MLITSDRNNTIKLIKSLKLKKYREETGMFFVEGERGVSEGIKAGTELVYVILSESFEKTEAAAEARQKISSCGNDPEKVLITVTDKIFTSLSVTPAPCGICGVFRMRKQPADLSEYILPEYCKAVLLENIQDPGNMGTIIRTADAAGFDLVICSKGCVDVYNPKVLRSTVGSVFRIPVILSEDTGKDITEKMKALGFISCGAVPKGGTDFFKEDLEGRILLIIGNEANGISRETEEICDKKLTIPMPGGTESLNASVAAAVLIYEILRKSGGY